MSTATMYETAHELTDADTFYCDEHGWVAVVSAFGVFRIDGDDCPECDDTLRRLTRRVAA